MAGTVRVYEWITTRVSRTRDGYAITESMGIAAREEPVNNAAFTNMGAVVVLFTGNKAISAEGGAKDANAKCAVLL